MLWYFITIFSVILERESLGGAYSGANAFCFWKFILKKGMIKTKMQIKTITQQIISIKYIK